MSDDSNDGVLSDEDYKKIAKDVSALKAGRKQDAELTVGMDVPRREDVVPAAQREEKIELEEKDAPKPQGCVFCKIVKKEIPARVVCENDYFLAFLDIQPKSVGHVVIVSKRHVPEMIELNVAEQNSLNDVLREICLRMKDRLKASGYTIISSNGMSAGQTVPHFSMHVIPSYAAGAVELPVLNMIQPHRVPHFVMDDVSEKLSGSAVKDEKKTEGKGVYKGFGIE